MHKFPIGKSNIMKVAAKTDPIWGTYVNSGKPLPAVFPNSRKYFGSIYNQLSLGSCSGFGYTQFIIALLAQAGFPIIRLAENSQYWAERVIEGTVNEDSGATVAQGVEANQQRGAQFQSENPYDNEYFIRFKDTPVGPWFNEFKIPADRLKYIGQDAYTLSNILDALGQGLIVTAGIEVFNGIESPNCANTGILPMPAANEASIGGHWINYISADPVNKRVLAINQWDDTWGIKDPVALKGCFWLPYDYVAKYTMDAVVGYPPAKAPALPADPGPQTRPVHTYAIEAFWTKPQYTVDETADFGCKLTADGNTPISTIDTVWPYVTLSDGEDGPVPTFDNGTGGVPWMGAVGVYTATARWLTPTGPTIYSGPATTVIVAKAAPKLPSVPLELYIDTTTQGVVYQGNSMVPPAYWQQAGAATIVGGDPAGAGMYQVNGKTYVGVVQDGVLCLVWTVMRDNGFKLVPKQGGGWRFEKTGGQ